MNLQKGDIVTGIYKTGKYIGEITDIRPQHYLVKVLAVIKHPVQGDLHHPKQVDVPLFHERKALSFQEQTNIPKQMVRIYDGEIPNYEKSLQQALMTLKQDLHDDGSEWANRSLQCLKKLEQAYY
ncbi:kinase-associated lipoprotein B [Bacillus sp. FJAT-47783]|uniref:kinase-associated lipoprotein B n=1 Tax=Bacillus sp. FJAT-47783 TaxID=2922712 RepID=UPI001FAB9025|nr:kinase-associated lipoprotein B [Bacillus sp. FJAT-47783]